MHSHTVPACKQVVISCGAPFAALLQMPDDWPAGSARRRRLGATHPNASQCYDTSQSLNIVR